MTYSEIQKFHHDILEAVMDKRLGEALSILSKLMVQISSADLHNRHNSISETYRNMLKYSFELAPDPERARIFNKLQRSILELSDDIREAWIRTMNLFNRAEDLKKYTEFESQYAGQPKQVSLKLSRKMIVEEQPEDPSGPLQEESDFTGLVFHYLWLKQKYDESAQLLFKQILDDKEVDTQIRSLMVSALTMSVLRHFDSQKLILLFGYSTSEDPEIRQRAMIGLFLTILAYRKRISLDKEIMGRLASIPDDKVFQERMLALLIQFIRATETEKITRKIQEEIVPEVMKMRSELEDKLNLDELLSKENFEEKNPEWENFFKDSPDVYQKLEQFSKMQIEGADVFMGAFAMLKHFSFFREYPNWFIPFRADNAEVLEAFETVKEEGLDVTKFLEGLEQSTVLCNSDKYSFCLNIQHMPPDQRKMMLELFNMELKAMNEMMEDEYKLNTESRNKIINTQYFQDLYRFFKLHPSRREYASLFDLEVDIFSDEVLRLIFMDVKIIRNLAEYYFAKDRYHEAVGLFTWLTGKDHSFELLEKLGFCYQKTGNFTRAIEIYKQAELFDRDKLWLQKKLGYCYRKTGDSQTAIEYYRDVNKAEPKDLNNLAYLGQLHMDIEDFEEALQYYYKVEYGEPENPKVYRPIGWCSFVLGKYENAVKYFEKVIHSKPGRSDYLNMGHCYWVTGKIEQALESYREALRISSGDTRWFREAFLKDGRYLLKAGMEELDISLMMDYVLMNG